jgi:hypothetical protein
MPSEEYRALTASCTKKCLLENECFGLALRHGSFLAEAVIVKEG